MNVLDLSLGTARDSASYAELSHEALLEATRRVRDNGGSIHIALDDGRVVGLVGESTDEGLVFFVEVENQSANWGMSSACESSLHEDIIDCLRSGGDVNAFLNRQVSTWAPGPLR